MPDFKGVVYNMNDRAKERPILFSGPMVRAILDGRKTQTRRVVTGENGCNYHDYHGSWKLENGLWFYNSVHGCAEIGLKCPYGVPGDVLWVREKARLVNMDRITGGFHGATPGALTRFKYESDSILSCWLVYPERLKPLKYDGCVPYGCFRELARIFLKVKDVRIERAQDIKIGDTIKEGIPKTVNFPIYGFQNLWDSLNAKRGYGWDVNPWVWVIGFERIDHDIQTHE